MTEKRKKTTFCILGLLSGIELIIDFLYQIAANCKRKLGKISFKLHVALNFVSL